MQAFREAYQKLSAPDQQAFLSASTTQMSMAGTQAAQVFSRGIFNYASSLTGNLTGMQATAAQKSLESISASGDYRRIIDVLRGSSGDEALRAAMIDPLTGSEIFRDVNRLFGLDDAAVARLGKQGIMGTFKSLTAGDARSIDEIVKAAGDDPNKLRNLLATKLLSSEQVAAGAKDAQANKVEVLLNQTAHILDGITKKLGIEHSKQAAA